MSMTKAGELSVRGELQENALGGLRNDDRNFVVALARGLEVLRAFRVRDGFLGNQEISERTGLPRPTISRLTYTLCQLGYLTKVERIGKYQLAPSAIALGYAALANVGIRKIARPLIQAAAEELSAPVALGVLDRNRALYIDIARGSATFTVQLDIGSRIPLATTAMGCALIAAASPADREKIFSGLSERYGDDWSACKSRIDEALEFYRTDGYVIRKGSWRSDINAVGVPLVAADGSGTFAFNCGGPPNEFTIMKIKTVVGPALKKLVRQVDTQLSGEIHLNMRDY
jgi:DNA-binding IclR family transcriptional regulator